VLRQAPRIRTLEGRGQEPPLGIVGGGELAFADLAADRVHRHAQGRGGVV